MEHVTNQAVDRGCSESFGSLLLAASKHGHLRALKAILPKIEIGAEGIDGQEALLQATEGGNMDAARALIMWGARIDDQVNSALSQYIKSQGDTEVCL